MMKGLVIWKDGHASLEEMKKPEIGEIPGTGPG